MAKSLWKVAFESDGLTRGHFKEAQYPGHGMILASWFDKACSGSWKEEGVQKRRENYALGQGGCESHQSC